MDFYTYTWLREDDSPYYVGKGSGRRAFRKGCPSRDRIRIQFWPDEATAFAFEIYQIDFWGRKDLGTGILRNMTNGGDGLVEIASKGGLVTGNLPHIKEMLRKQAGEAGHLGGKVQGPRNAASGQMAKVGRLYGKMYGRIQGNIQGRKNVESGQLRSIAVEGSRAGNQQRWHIDRGTVSPACSLCRGVSSCL